MISALVLAALQLVIWRQPSFAEKENTLRTTSRVMFALLSLCFIGLVTRFITSDFSLSVVAANSHISKPLFYKFIAVWGNHEGSMLLWVWILGLVSFGLSFSKKYPKKFSINLLGVQASLILAFASFSLLTSNPFDRVFPPPLSGQDLNPLLQDPSLGIHPPGLYLGYVGSSVLFVFAIAGLMQNKIDHIWAKWLKPWARLCWLFLTLGIVLGSRWAYYELGWGGWWFWDPVENASLMPWLSATALIHSLNVLEKRKQHAMLCAFLCLLTFCLSLSGTFFVRSGLITSVHSFASDPSRGLYLFCLFLFFSTLSFGYFTYRLLGKPQQKTILLSREGFILASSILFIISICIVFLGTTYPLILESINGKQISVGPPFYTKTMWWLGILMPALMGLASLSPWNKLNLKKLEKKLVFPVLLSMLCGVITCLITGSGFVSIGFAMAAWIFFTTFTSINEKRKKTPLSMVAMWIAHIGVAFFMIGAVGSSGLKTEAYRAINVGETISFDGFNFHLTEITTQQKPNYKSQQAVIKLNENDILRDTLLPEKRFYVYAETTTVEADFKTFLSKDVYVTLGDQTDSGAWSIYIVIEPLILMLWLGAGFVVLGGMISFISGFKK